MNEETIYSKNNQKILAFLCDNPDGFFYSNQIAEKINLSNGGVNQSLRLLVKESLLISEKKGRMIFYQVDISSPIIREFKIFRTVLLLNKFVQRLKNYTEKIVLFGSCAEGTNFKDSDIDLLVVSQKKRDVNNELNKFKYKQKVQLILKSPQEYMVLEKKEPIFFTEIEKGRLLWQGV